MQNELINKKSEQRHTNIQLQSSTINVEMNEGKEIQNKNKINKNY